MGKLLTGKKILVMGVAAAQVYCSPQVEYEMKTYEV